MDEIQVVMAMAGRGQRFRDAGYETPKPLILVDGVPMFMKALTSIAELKIPIKLFLIVRSDYEVDYQIRKMILQSFPLAQVTMLADETRGAAETVLSISDQLISQRPLLIMDCDILFKSDDFKEAIENLHDSKIDGHLISFKSEEPRYSYVIASSGVATQVVEKKVISNEALIGAYFWSKSSDFEKYTRKVMELGINDEMKEYFISSVVQLAIENGLLFKVHKGVMQSFGTPEELLNYEIRGGV